MKHPSQDPFEIYSSSSGRKKTRQLDWEESAADSQSYISEVYDSQRMAPNFFWLWLFLACVFLVIEGRVFFLQIIHGRDFSRLSENNGIRQQSLLAPRGLILDRSGKVLAQNAASFNLVAVPFDLPKENLPQEVEGLANIFAMDPADIYNQLKSTDKGSINPVIIKQDVPNEQSILFDTRSAEFTGFSIQQVPSRDYLEAPMFSHVLGYTGLVSPGDLAGKDAGRYDNIDFIGKTGVEAVYEDYLHGTNGQNLIEADATGKPLNVLGQNNPLPGNTVELNIDKDLQERLYQDLSKQKRAAAIALNPRNGQVLALVSVPGFDNNLFAHGIKPQDYQNLLSDKNLPLFNRAISGTYPPGSTVKPMVASAALQEGIVNENTVIYDRGVLVIPNQYNSAISYNFYGWNHNGLGAMTVRKAIAMSSDIYFYTAAGGYPNTAVPQGLGAQRLADYYRKYNLGKTTGIDLQGEKSGLVPDPAWKAAYFKSDPILSKWYLGDTYHLGIGQGDLLVTPLQVAEWTSIIANNGSGFKPQVLSKVLDTTGRVIFQNKPEILVKDFIDPLNVKIVQEGMRQTVLAGTAKALQSLPVTSAGKTGTSQFDGSNPLRTHAWFTAYAPFEDPQIVITVLVEAGGEGNAVAEPVVKDALQWWAANRYKKN